MSFIDKFKKKNYAADFKKAFEKDDFSDMASIMMKWVDDNKNDDANFTLAMIIFMSNSSDRFSEMEKFYQRSKFQEPQDKKLYVWYKDTVDRIMNNHKNESSYPGSGDDGYAREFLDCLNKFEILTDESDQSELYSKMQNIVNKWGDKYPDDANYTCAYVIVNIMELSQSRLAELLIKANSQIPIDESCHADLLGNMTKFAMIKNGDDELAGVMDDLLNDTPDKGYAKEFLKCLDGFNSISDYSEQKNLLNKMRDIVDKWEDDYPDDANFTCAYIITNIFDLSEGRIAELMLKINNQTPLDENSHSRIKEYLANFISNKQNGENTSNKTNLVEKSRFNGPDGGLAKEFLHCINEFENETDSDVQKKLYERMTEIMDEWGKKYPDDYNYACADIIMNLMDLSEKEILDRMMQLPSKSAVDEEVKDELFKIMVGLFHEKTSDSKNDESEIKSSSSDDGFAKELVNCITNFSNPENPEEQNKSYNKMKEIVERWGKKYPDDANYTYAQIMVNGVRLSSAELIELLKKARSQTPVDRENHGFLKMSAERLVSVLYPDAFDDFNNSSKRGSESSQSNEFSDLNCSQFAKKFIACFDKAKEGDSVSAVREMGQIVDAWEKKCPDDANFTCAYIMVNIDRLSGSEISELVDKINEQTPVDEDSFMFMLSNMMDLVKFVNVNN